MILTLCLGDGNALLFNRRRLSRDRAQQEDLLALCAPGPLYLAPYSARLFSWAPPERLRVDGDFLSRAGDGEWCFLEDRTAALALRRAEEVVVYRWNRAYPADVRVDLTGWSRTESRDFPGTSHERITRERYRRGGIAP